jgi:hypothetical protein
MLLYMLLSHIVYCDVVLVNIRLGCLVGLRSCSLGESLFASAVYHPITALSTVGVTHQDFLRTMSTINKSLSLICNKDLSKFKVMASAAINRNNRITALHGIYITRDAFRNVNNSFAIGNDKMYYRSVQPLIQYLKCGEQYSFTKNKPNEGMI